MRIISNVFFLGFLICLITSCQRNRVQSGEDPACEIIVKSFGIKYYVFENWDKVGKFVCSTNWFSIKDIQGSRKGNFKNGLQDGKWVVEKYHYYDSIGYSRSKRYLSREEYFKNGLRDSIFKIYSHEGKVIYSTTFKKGNGIEKDYYDNGQLYYEITTKDGYFTDTLKLFYPTGKLMEKRLYQKDSLVYSIRFDK